MRPSASNNSKRERILGCPSMINISNRLLRICHHATQLHLRHFEICRLPLSIGLFMLASPWSCNSHSILVAVSRIADSFIAPGYTSEAAMANLSGTLRLPSAPQLDFPVPFAWFSCCGLKPCPSVAVSYRPPISIFLPPTLFLPFYNHPLSAS